MKQTKRLIILITVFCVILTSCNTYQKIDDTVIEMLDYMQIKDSKILSVGKYEMSAYKLEVKVSEDDIINYINPIFGFESEQSISLLNDTLVQENTEFNTVKEYLEYVKTYLFYFKRYQMYTEHKSEFLLNLIENSKFELKEKEVLNYAADLATSYEKLANDLGMSLENYYTTILKKSELEFFDMCYQEAIIEIKQYLLVGALATNLNIKISEDELKSAYQEYNYNENYILNNPDSVCYLRYSLLENKVMQLVLYGYLLDEYY